MPKLTADQELTAVQMYQDGASTTQISASLNITQPTVRSTLSRHGVALRPRPGRSTTQPREVVEAEVVRLRLDGVRVRDIATRVRASTLTVAEILEQRGLHTRLKRGGNSTARRKFSPEQDQTLAQEYLAGASAEQLAKKYGCQNTAVRAAVRRAGGVIRRRGGAIAPFSRDPVFRDKVKTLWEQGLTQVAIGKALGCSSGLVSRVLRRHFGVKCRAGGARHGMWKGGRVIGHQGYVWILLAHNHPLAAMRNASGYVLEHRLVMAEYLRRPLLPHETVHHKDQNKAHNEITNLQLRIGRHGTGACYRCSDCGSHRLEPVEL